MTDDAPMSGEIHSGQVKWFDSARGFGFIRSDEVEGDILLHANVLRNFGQSSISDGSFVRFRAVETRRGYQASEVVEISAPSTPPEDETTDPCFSDHDLDSSPLVAARVKWFDRSKGFGFANVFGKNDDVFIHIDVLRRSALSDLQPGEAIAIRVAEGDRGHLATQVSVWESAQSDSRSSD